MPAPFTNIIEGSRTGISGNPAETVESEPFPNPNPNPCQAFRPDEQLLSKIHQSHGLTRRKLPNMLVAEGPIFVQDFGATPMKISFSGLSWDIPDA